MTPLDTSPRAAPVGILLAAGAGSRFDPSGQRQKLLAVLPGGAERGLPVGFVAARRLRAVLPRVVAVVRPGAHELSDWLARAGCEIVVAQHAGDGMGASLATAVDATPSEHGWVVALADMPAIAPATIRMLIDQLDGPETIVAPRYAGQRGHPVVFGGGLGAALRALDGDTGARALLQSRPLKLVDTQDAGVLRDIDTPADL